MTRRVLILHSGGLDSTVCLLIAKDRGHVPISLGIDYRQTHLIEMNYAQRQCERFGVERRVVQVKWDKPTRTIPIGRELEEIKRGVSPAFLPGRNTIFLSLAVAEAAGINASEIWTGVNSIDFSGYPDCTPKFIDAFRRLSNISNRAGPKIVAPLQNKSKPAIARLAKRLGLTKADTWSCYRPQITTRGIEPCSKCDACRLHEYAWENV